MYVVAIGWLYVALMMAITEQTVVAAVATFLLYGVGPVALLLYILGTPGRRRRRREAERTAEAEVDAEAEAEAEAEEKGKAGASPAAAAPPPDGGTAGGPR